MRKRSSLRPAAALVRLLAIVPLLMALSPLGAQVSERASRVTLEEAVERTLRNSYALQRATAAVARREGALQEISGLFDDILFVDVNAQEQQFALISGEENGEIRRRVPLEFLGIALPDGPPGALDRAADQLIRSLPSEGTLRFADCATVETEQGQVLQLETPLIVELESGETVVLCLNSDGVPVAIQEAGDLNFGETQRLLDTIQLLSDLFGDDIDEQLADLIRDIEENVSDLLRGIARDLRLTAEALRVQRARLGDLPEERELLDFRFELGYRWRYRNGLQLTSSFALIGTEDNYADKPLDPAFGDSLAPNTFTGSAAVALDVPLGKGRGRIATAGPELASAAAVRAERELWLHTASVEALNTVSAYWDLVAAEQRLELLERSLDAQNEISEVTRALIEADELPAVEENRAIARRAEVASQIAAARQALVTSRLALVQAMGQSTRRLEETPLAAEPLPTDSAIEDRVEPWVERALDERRDLAAASEAVLASDILARSARANLRYQVDLVMSTSFSGFHESFDDRFYDFDGYWEALSGDISGPSYRIGLRFALPFRNRAARGRLVQAQASLEQSQINQRDLQRRIEINVQEQIVSLRRQREEIERLRENLRYLEETYEASSERFQIGDLTLIDTLTTEQQLTQARLALLDAERRLADLVARVLFESGALLVGDPDPADLDPGRLGLAPGLSGGRPTLEGP